MFDPPKNPKPLIAVGIFCIAAGAAMTPHTIANLREVWTDSYVGDDFGFEEFFSKLGGIIYMAIAVVVDVGGVGLTTFGSVKGAEYDRFSEQRAMLGGQRR